tara:strand:+ start:364 stop:516 length:153 start_codon:yes stop_codon:yes gene_type:complete
VRKLTTKKLIKNNPIDKDRLLISNESEIMCPIVNKKAKYAKLRIIEKVSI